VSRQSAIPCLHPQENDWLKVGQDLFTLTQFGCPSSFLFIKPLETMYSHFGQAQPTEGVTPHLEGILAFLLFALPTLLMPSIEFVERVFTLAFRFGSETAEDRFDFAARLRSQLFNFRPVFHQAVPNVPGGWHEAAPIVVVEDRDNLHLPERLVVKGDPPERPVTNNLCGQAR
jgi:hypothetical protein